MPIPPKPLRYVTGWVDPFTGETHRLHIRHTRDYLAQDQDHIEIESAKGAARRSHPLSATGYLSHFMPALDLANAGGPVTFVDAWINRALASKEWRQTETKRRQGDLFQWADARDEIAANAKSARRRKPKPSAKSGRPVARKRGPS